MSSPTTFRPDDEAAPMLNEMAAAMGGKTETLNRAVKLLYRQFQHGDRVHVPVKSPALCMVCGAKQTQYMVFDSDGSFGWRCADHKDE